MSERAPTEIMTYVDGRGREIAREVRLAVPDIRAFLGLGGFPLLVLAANPHLSLGEVVRYLSLVAQTTPGQARTKTWAHKLRKLFHRPHTAEPLFDPDGQHGRALAIMAAHPKLSARNLSKLLAEHGIKRKKDWCRAHRCDGLAAGVP